MHVKLLNLLETNGQENKNLKAVKCPKSSNSYAIMFYRLIKFSPLTPRQFHEVKDKHRPKVNK